MALTEIEIRVRFGIEEQFQSSLAGHKMKPALEAFLAEHGLDRKDIRDTWGWLDASDSDNPEMVAVALVGFPTQEG
jgi:hypothetical protein